MVVSSTTHTPSTLPLIRPEMREETKKLKEAVDKERAETARLLAERDEREAQLKASIAKELRSRLKMKKWISCVPSCQTAWGKMTAH